MYDKNWIFEKELVLLQVDILQVVLIKYYN